MKQNMDGMLVDRQAEPWRNAHVSPPNIGATVRVLTIGGIDVGKVTWVKESIKSYDGWLPLNPVPPEIKAIQQSRLAKAPEISGNQLPEGVDHGIQP